MASLFAITPAMPAISIAAQLNDNRSLNGGEQPMKGRILTLAFVATAAISFLAQPDMAAAQGNRMTDWSGWARAEGVEYRYRVRWDPSKSGQMVTAIYEIRNLGSRRWYGSARSLDCDQNRDASASGPLTVDPGQTTDVRLEALNCGTATNPIIHPKLRASSIL